MKVVDARIDYNFEPETPVVLMFTANNVITQRGALVMGAGNALACKQAMPGIDFVFGEMVQQYPEKHVQLKVIGMKVIGMFRTKNHWNEPSTIELVRQSAKELEHLALEHRQFTFCLPAPAIGCGGLDWGAVRYELSGLPDNVIVFK